VVAFDFGVRIDGIIEVGAKAISIVVILSRDGWFMPRVVV
jgi:hypothetical protein